MKGVKFDSKPTDQSNEYAQLLELILVILNRVSVELTLEAQGQKSTREDQFRVSVRLMHSACVLGTMLPELVKERSIRLPNALPIARMYYERLLSAAYVMSDDGSAARRAIHYSVYSIFKNQKMLFSAGGHQELIQERFQISRKSNAVAAALEFFKESKSPQEFEHDRDARRKIIAEQSGKAALQFKAVEQAGHAASSEVVHGSYLSTILYSSEPKTGTPEKGLDELMTLVMLIVVCSSEALGHLLVKQFPDLPSPSLLIDAGKTFMSMELPEASDLIDRAYSRG